MMTMTMKTPDPSDSLRNIRSPKRWLGAAPRADRDDRRLREVRSDDRTRTCPGRVRGWVRGGLAIVTVNPSRSVLLPLKPGYCIALIAVTRRSLTLSGNGT